MFLAKPMKGCRTKYRRAEALRFAVEELRIPKVVVHNLPVRQSALASDYTQ
jgi:hypothetical protein